MSEGILKISQEQEDPFKKEVQKQLELAKRDMFQAWGIENLTTIEGVHLRHIAEDCVKQYAEEDILQKEGKFEDAHANRIQLPKEIMLRWLHELYGISENELNIHHSKMVWNMEDNTEYEFDRDDRVGPKKKIEELSAKGQHSIAQLAPTSSEFKEYIRRLREKAQIPERK